MVLSGTSMAAAVTSGAMALMLEANRTANAYPARPSLTPNAVKAMLQFSALRLHDDPGQEYDTLRQGAGALNLGGAIELAKSVDTSAPVGSWWLVVGRHHVDDHRRPGARVGPEHRLGQQHRLGHHGVSPTSPRGR